mgnify:CR=1 FL=1
MEAVIPRGKKKSARGGGVARTAYVNYGDITHCLLTELESGAPAHMICRGIPPPPPV